MRNDYILRGFAMEQKNYFAPYELQFDEKERKVMLGEMMKTLREQRKMTQEKLVRLSFIFKCPTDILLQRNVFFHGKEAMLNALNGWENDMNEAEKKINGIDDPNIISAVKGMQTLISQMKDMLNNQK